MMVLPVVAILAACVTVGHCGHLTFSDCNNSPNKVFHIDAGHISPDPVHIPGPETVDITLHVLREVSGRHFRLNVKIQKKFLLSWITIPCTANIGTCSYDVCTMLSGFTYPNGTTHCPLEVAQSSPGFPCSCPFQPGTYKMNPTIFTIPELNGLYSWLASGDYRVSAHVTDTTTGEEVSCYSAAVSVTEDCKGFACLFGR